MLARGRGYSLIELIIAMTIAAIVLAIAVPSFNESIVNSRSRGVAESIQSGLLLARSEAVKRNAPMRFQLVTAFDDTCARTATSRLWLVTQYVGLTAPPNSRGLPDGQCAAAAYVPPDQEEPCPTTPAYSGSLASCLDDPFIAYRGAADAVPGIDVAGTPTMGTTPVAFVVTFGPLGQLLANLEGAAPTTNPAYRVQVNPSSGSGRQFCVQVNANGNIRLCQSACNQTCV